MGTLIVIALVAGAIWFIFFAKERTAAVTNNVVVIVVAGGIGLALLASGTYPVVAIAALAYAGWGAYQTVGWFTKPGDDEPIGTGDPSTGATASPAREVSASTASPLTPTEQANEHEAATVDADVLQQLDWTGVSSLGRRVGELLARDPWKTFEELGAELDCEPREISDAVEQLEQRDWVVRQRGGHYAFTPPSAS